MQEIMEKFTNHLKNVLTRALCLVVEQGGDTIGVEHLLWAVGTEEGCVGAEVLVKAGIKQDALRALVGAPTTVTTQARNIDSPTPLLSDECKQAIEKAVLTASMYEHRYVGTEHLLSGILQLGKGDVQTFFHNQGVREGSLSTSLSAIFKTTSTFPDVLKQDEQEEHHHHHEHDHEHDGESAVEGDSKTPALDFFTVELTTREAASEIDPLIGREKEVARLAHILLRRTKNNPLLVGEPGVGKTAIVEGLAKAIVEGKVPDALLNKRILRLDLASLVAGTMYRGDFENRVQQVLDEVHDRPDLILFIDEIHTIVGAGSASGSLDAANILKPALARGELRCIGATTLAEYKKDIEPDGALDRRFQVIHVKEPSLAEAKVMIEGLRPNYEKFHGVAFDDDAVETALVMADRYLHGKQFPDKAIDVLDEAGAAAVLKNASARRAQQVRDVENMLRAVRLEKTAAVFDERFADALSCKTREEALLQELETLQKAVPHIAAKRITRDDILKAVAHMTGIPVETLSETETDKLRTLEDRLAKRVVGQKDAVRRVSQALRRAKLGLARRERPLASFLFVGPSGVGKTELARAIAQELFDDKNAFVRFDMSEFSEGFTVSKLLGSPAGYVGYREGAKLTDAVKARPHCVVLFDELEKAHPDVHNILLQLLDDGIITDATGRTVSFKNAIVIMTTNAGRERFFASGVGFGEATDTSDEKFREDLRRLLEDFFRPELLNRIDHTCLFRPLVHADFTDIARLALQELQARAKDTGVSLTFAPTVAGEIAKRVNQKLGARDVRRVIEEHIEHQLADTLLATSKRPHELHVSPDGKGVLNVTPVKRLKLPTLTRRKTLKK